MKKHFFNIAACIVISLVFLQISCHSPAGPSTTGGTEPPQNPAPKTLIVFDNTYGICAALVYDDYRRRDMDKVAEVPAGKSSAEFEWTPGVSTPFYFSYRVALKGVSGFTVDFVPEVGKDQKAVRIDAGTRTVIPIPALDEAVSSQEQTLSPKSYLSITNDSIYSFQLHRGVSMIRPDNSPDSGVVSSGERAPYTVNPGRSADYRLLVGADYKALPDSPARFEAGNFYSYIFTDNVSLDAEIPINLDNVDVKTYAVSFDGNGGSGTIPATQSVRAASGITLPLGSGLSNGDNIFGGWCADASGAGIVYSAGTRYTVTGDITLYAKWYPAGTTLYTVAFDSAGGNETASQSMVSGAVAIRPADPYRAGYTFGGWYRDQGAQSPYDFATPVTESLTLYAAWTANRYTVTFNVNGAEGTAPAAVTVDYGYVITLPTADGLSKQDETFNGWNTDDSGAGTAYASGAQYTVTGDVTLFAVWNPVEPPPGDIDGFIKMAWVPGGSFMMGKNLGTGEGSDEIPMQIVTLSGFYMGKYEVTQAQYEAVMETTVVEQQALTTTSTTDYGRGDDYPMYYVSWYDALVFCNRLSIAEGLSPAYRILGSTDPSDWRTVPTSGNGMWDAVEIINGSNGYRLPTEAQWEYAAKGGDGSPGSYTYAGSDNPDDVAWYYIGNTSTTHAVGTKAPNGLGIYDMSGNVSEWCWDWYGSYTIEEKTDPAGVPSGSNRVQRGGNRGQSVQYVSSARRNYYSPSSRLSNIGFRLVRPTGSGVISPPPLAGDIFSVSTPEEFALAFSAIQSRADTNFTVTVTADMILGPYNLSGEEYANKTITLRGDTPARTISFTNLGSLFTVGADVELVLENIVLQGRSDNNASLVRVGADGKLVLNSGEISGNTTSSSGGGVVVVANGTFTMEGGKISNNTTTSSGGGGGVIVGGNFTMTGGEISDNTSRNTSGGGVYVTGGTFTMEGGIISGNTAASSASGGGVFITTNGTFTMTGGEISGNTAGFRGGGVWVTNNSGGIFIKTGGTVYGYTAGNSNSNVVKDGNGNIQNNRGHAVYVFVRSTSRGAVGSQTITEYGRFWDDTIGPTVNLNSSQGGTAVTIEYTEGT